MTMEIKKVLHGKVRYGCGDAKNWGVADIRRVTGRDLVPGTVNVELDEPHKMRSHYRLPKSERIDGRPEDLDFERCVVVMERGSVPALIARTSTNFWGDKVLEIMADKNLRDHYGLKENDRVQIEVWIEEDGTTPSTSD